MSFTRQQYAKVAPTLPTGEVIATYPTYADAQKAIAHLADQHFPVESLTIVGTDLTSVERVTGRLSYGRVAIAGAMSGAWFGLFVGLLMSMFGGQTGALGVWPVSIGIGAGFGLLFSVLSYGLTRSRRDFTSSSQIVANQYAVWCVPGAATEARRLLSGSPVGTGQRLVIPPTVPTAHLPQIQDPNKLTTYHGPTVSADSVSNPGEGAVVSAGGATIAAAPAPAAAAQSEAPKIDTRWVTADGKPKFGALAADHPGVALPAVVQSAQPKPSEHINPAVTPVVTPDNDHPDNNQNGNSQPKDPFDPFAPPPKK